MADVTGPGRRLNERFRMVGTFNGKSMQEIIVVVGRPTSVSAMAFNQTLLQWQATGYHIALLFDANGIFLKKTHEFANFTAKPSGCAAAVILLVGSGGTIAVLATHALKALLRA